MQLKKLTLKHPSHLIQVFRKVQHYNKTERMEIARTGRIQWQSELTTHPQNAKLGFVQDDELYLSPAFCDEDYFSSGHGIILVDSHPHSHSDSAHYPNATSHCCTMRDNFDIFELSLRDMELYLRYSYLRVGVPKRHNFKLCDLKQNQPVEILINGKFDHTISSGRQRSFKEQSYIINYLGKFEHYYQLREPIQSVVKQIPQQRKVVDLSKIIK